jgi:putative inorganic carbon (HCO3(-)) transporter
MRPEPFDPPAPPIPLPLALSLGAFVASSAFTIAGSQTALGLTLALWIVFGALRRAPGPRRTTLDLPLGLFIAVCLVAALASNRRVESLVNLRNLLLASAIYAVGFLARGPRLRGRLFSALVVAGTGSALYGIALYLLGRGRGALGRTSGSFSTAMTYGGILLILGSVFMAVALERSLPRRFRLAVLGAAAAVFAALFFSFTRSSWIGAVVSVAVLLAVLRRRLLVPFAAGLVLLVLVLPAPYRARVESIWNPAFRTNVQRLELLRGGTAIVREHPVIGVGTMDLADVYRAHMPPGAVHVHGHMHNDFLQVAVQTGLVGLAAFVFLLASFARLIVGNLRAAGPPAERAWAAGSLGALAGFVVNGLFEWNFGDAEVVTLLYIVIGANLAMRRERLRARP